jgi:hypothetical protein
MMLARTLATCAAVASLLGACRDSFVPHPANEALPVATAPTAPAPVAARSGGRITGLAGHRAAGSVTLRVDGDGVAVLTMHDDFVMDAQPDPHVYLNTEPTVHRGAPLRVGALAQSRGGHRYVFRLPAGGAPTKYTHVVIWCNRYDVGLAQAPLASTP